jgi:DNA-binding NarL/FixJ family response regulator
MSIAVSIIEDDRSVRQHLIEAINSSPLCTLVGAAGNKAEAMTLIASNETDVYLVDLGLPDIDGVDLIASIKKSCESAQSLVLSAFGDAKHISRSIRAGAMGYLLKEEQNTTLIDKIVSLHNGLAPISPLVAKILIQQINSTKAVQHNDSTKTGVAVHIGLRAREIEVLKYLSTGLSIMHIADKLFISTHTVNQHLRSIYRKLDVRSRSMAVHVARQNGILEE